MGVAEEYKRISRRGEGEHSDAFVEVLYSRLLLGGRCCFGGREDRSVFRCLRGLASRRGSLLPESSEKSA